MAQCFSIEMCISRLCPAWTENEVSELCHDGIEIVREWQGRGVEGLEECALDTGGFQLLPLSSFSMARAGKRFWHRLNVINELADDHEYEAVKMAAGRDAPGNGIEERSGAGIWLYIWRCAKV